MGVPAGTDLCASVALLSLCTTAMRTTFEACTPRTPNDVIQSDIWHTSTRPPLPCCRRCRRLRCCLCCCLCCYCSCCFFLCCLSYCIAEASFCTRRAVRGGHQTRREQSASTMYCATSARFLGRSAIVVEVGTTPYPVAVLRGKVPPCRAHQSDIWIGWGTQKYAAGSPANHSRECVVYSVQV